jgi:hypothetical protein
LSKLTPTGGPISWPTVAASAAGRLGRREFPGKLALSIAVLVVLSSAYPQAVRKSRQGWWDDLDGIGRDVATAAVEDPGWPCPR